MQKKFIVRLSDAERQQLREVVGKLKGTSQKVKRAKPPTPKLLDGKQEAQVIAMRLGPPPKGYANWTLRLLARKVVELEIVGSISRCSKAAGVLPRIRSSRSIFLKGG